MMIRKFLFVLVLALVSFAGNAQVFLADPFVMRHEGTYYLYGTDDKAPNNGIPVYVSRDLRSWVRQDSLALTKGNSFGTKGFWAPYVVFHKGLFYMYYTANEKIAVATSESPTGPFTQQEHVAMSAGDTKDIDPHVFIDENGQKYIYFVRLQNGNRSFAAELDDDMKTIRQPTIVECISQSQPWEIISGDKWPVTEAPSILKYRNKYYLFYTANDFRSPAYNVGYAVSDSPLGPFKKSEHNPIIGRNDSIVGTGGCEFVTDADNNLLMFYHSHYSLEKPTPRKTLFSKVKFLEKRRTNELEIKVDSARHQLK